MRQVTIDRLHLATSVLLNIKNKIVKFITTKKSGKKLF